MGESTLLNGNNRVFTSESEREAHSQTHHYAYSEHVDGEYMYIINTSIHCTSTRLDIAQNAGGTCGQEVQYTCTIYMYMYTCAASHIKWDEPEQAQPRAIQYTCTCMLVI